MTLDDKNIQENADAVIRSQYEVHPYPPRDPDDERRRLITGSPRHIHEINHYVFGGKRDFSKPFRALIAGGGTGDAVQALDDAVGNIRYQFIIARPNSSPLISVGSAKISHANASRVSFATAASIHSLRARELTTVYSLGAALS